MITEVDLDGKTLDGRRRRLDRRQRGALVGVDQIASRDKIGRRRLRHGGAGGRL